MMGRREELRDDVIPVLKKLEAVSHGERIVKQYELKLKLKSSVLVVKQDEIDERREIKLNKIKRNKMKLCKCNSLFAKNSQEIYSYMH